MESLVISWRELLFIAIVVLAVYVAEMLLLLRVRRRRVAELFSEQVLADLQQELNELRGELSGLHREVAEFRKGQQSEQSTATPYSQAIQLARDGREVADLAVSCGISRGEAELIVALYRAHS